MPQHPFWQSTRSFICHMGLGQILASDRYALAVHFLIIACLRILKCTVIAITTHGDKSETSSCVSEELTLKLRTGHGKRRGTGGKGEEHRRYSEKFLQLLALGRCGDRPVTAAVIKPLNGELLCCSGLTAHLPGAPCTPFRNLHTSLAL